MPGRADLGHDPAPRIREERAGDHDGIATAITSAFASAPHSSGTEAAIVSALRRVGALALSLVAEQDEHIRGHIAFSQVAVADGSTGWYGLGPVAVVPSAQGSGIGSALVRAGLDRLRGLGANGCVVLGDPAWYQRFGFRRMPGLRYPDAPEQYFMALPFGSAEARGEVAYHAAFSARAE